jgi:hypothetical protein
MMDIGILVLEWAETVATRLDYRSRPIETPDRISERPPRGGLSFDTVHSASITYAWLMTELGENAHCNGVDRFYYFKGVASFPKPSAD